MGNTFTLIEKLNCNIFCLSKKDKHKNIMDSLYRVSKQYKISILPISNIYELDNLYPITDRVKEWNTFIVGNDKTYILSNIGDNRVYIPKDNDMVDTKGASMPEELFLFLDNVWTHTLKGKQLQFYMILNGQIYLINTYCLNNANNKVIGAIMFMRNFETLPNYYSENMNENMNKDTRNFLEVTNNVMHNKDINK